MKALTTTGLTKLIELSKDNFIDKTDTVPASTVTLATVATSGDYNDLSNKPTIPTVPVTDVTVGGTSVVSSGVAVVPAIPTVNNPTITITQGGVTKGSFTLNQSSGDTIALDAGGSGGTLDSLSDVIITSATNGQVLTYDNGDWVNADSTGGYHPDLFDWKWADHQLNDVQWLRADTFSWQDGGVYEAAYDHLEADITGKTLTSETVAGVTVQFYLADDGHKICPDTEESNVASIYTATGVAWYYIIDTVNERFKLPRTKFGVTGLRDTVGKYVAPGLPDITSGNAAVMAWYNNQSTWTQGSLKKTDTTAGSIPPSGNWTNTGITALRASLESSIYGNSTTVQAPATQMYLYFYVGEFTQTALENTAGLNAELFNEKADINAQNFDSTGRAYLAGLAMPSDTYDDLTLGASGTTYTAPADGYIYINKYGSTSEYIQLDAGRFSVKQFAPNYANTQVIVFAPINKGRQFSVTYDLSGITSAFRFIYANGAK